MVNSRAKGKRGELETAHHLNRLFDCNARRGQQFKGSPDSPDIITDMAGIHIEVKYVESFSLYKALDQSRRDAGDTEVPVVIHKKRRQVPVVIVELDRLPELADRIVRHLQKRTDLTPLGRESQGAG